MERRKSSSGSLTLPLNKTNPIRIAFLGGPKTGKSSLISKIVTGNYTDTYYPLRKMNPVLFTFKAQESKLRALLDPKDAASATEYVKSKSISLSPVLKSALLRSEDESSTKEATDTVSKNKHYHIYNTDKPNERLISPLLVELIDTPAFEAKRSVPFLEVSLHAKLAKADLRNLANDSEQRVDVNAVPLLVASGAADLNGAIDGYVFVYSAVPPVDIPQYDFNLEPTQSTESSLSILPLIREGLIEAWSEYYTYRIKSQNCGESDIFSFKTAIKSMFDSKERKEFVYDGKLETISTDPYDKLCLPPIVMVCTHKNLRLMSPKLIQDGREYASRWNCTFVAVDLSEDVDCVLNVMVRELVERRCFRKTK